MQEDAPCVIEGGNRALFAEGLRVGAGAVFGLSGMVILAFLAWREVRAFAAARYRIQQRLQA